MIKIDFKQRKREVLWTVVASVSYTHLTLPTT